MAFNILYAALFAFSTFVLVAGDSCGNPKVTANGYTTQDATVLTNIAYIAQFSLECDGKPAEIPLYAELAGKPLSVVQTSGGYQVSWIEDVAKAPQGNFAVQIYDDESYATLRKAQRSGEDATSVKALASVVLNHPGAYKGPWINSELAATLLAIGVWYYAFSAKSKLIS